MQLSDMEQQFRRLGNRNGLKAKFEHPQSPRDVHALLSKPVWSADSFFLNALEFPGLSQQPGAISFERDLAPQYLAEDSEISFRGSTLLQAFVACPYGSIQFIRNIIGDSLPLTYATHLPQAVSFQSHKRAGGDGVGGGGRERIFGPNYSRTSAERVLVGERPPEPPSPGAELIEDQNITVLLPGYFLNSYSKNSGTTATTSATSAAGADAVDETQPTQQGFGIMHTKLMLLLYGDRPLNRPVGCTSSSGDLELANVRLLRVVVSSANFDLNMVTQLQDSYFVQDFPRRKVRMTAEEMLEQPGGAFAHTLAHHLAQLLRELHCQAAAGPESVSASSSCPVKILCNWPRLLAHFDFNRAGVALIPSVPGLYPEHCPSARLGGLAWNEGWVPVPGYLRFPLKNAAVLFASRHGDVEVELSLADAYAKDPTRITLWVVSDVGASDDSDDPGLLDCPNMVPQPPATPARVPVGQVPKWLARLLYPLLRRRAVQVRAIVESRNGVPLTRPLIPGEGPPYARAWLAIRRRQLPAKNSETLLPGTVIGSNSLGTEASNDPAGAKLSVGREEENTEGLLYDLITTRLTIVQGFYALQNSLKRAEVTGEFRWSELGREEALFAAFSPSTMSDVDKKWLDDWLTYACKKVQGDEQKQQPRPNKSQELRKGKACAAVPRPSNRLPTSRDPTASDRCSVQESQWNTKGYPLLVYPTMDLIRNGNNAAQNGMQPYCMPSAAYRGLRALDLLRRAEPQVGNCRPPDVNIYAHMKYVAQLFEPPNTASAHTTGGRMPSTTLQHQPYGWIYTGSHNFSRVAWGSTVDSGLGRGRRRYLRMNNYELGVLFIQQPMIKGASKPLVPFKGAIAAPFHKRFPLPYDLPGHPYGPRDEAQHMEAVLNFTQEYRLGASYLDQLAASESVDGFLRLMAGGSGGGTGLDQGRVVATLSPTAAASAEDLIAAQRASAAAAWTAAASAAAEERDLAMALAISLAQSPICVNARAVSGTKFNQSHVSIAVPLGDSEEEELKAAIALSLSGHTSMGQQTRRWHSERGHLEDHDDEALRCSGDTVGGSRRKRLRPSYSESVGRASVSEGVMDSGGDQLSGGSSSRGEVIVIDDSQ